MNDEEKLKIHILAEKKLSDLEETGLSREELLFDNSTKVFILIFRKEYLFYKTHFINS